MQYRCISLLEFKANIVKFFDDAFTSPLAIEYHGFMQLAPPNVTQLAPRSLTTLADFRGDVGGFMSEAFDGPLAIECPKGFLMLSRFEGREELRLIRESLR